MKTILVRISAFAVLAVAASSPAAGADMPLWQSPRHPALDQLAQQSAELMAFHCVQGHHQWNARHAQAAAATGLTCSEICAETWDRQTNDPPEERWHTAFDDWTRTRHGEYDRPHTAIGVGEAMGRNGVWYMAVIYGDGDLNEPPPLPPEQEPPAAEYAGADPVEVELLHLVNAERGRRGLCALVLDNALLNAAREQTVRMFRIGMQHSRGPWGENIAMGQPDAHAVMRSWMNSPGHRRNILNPNYTRFGGCGATSQRGTPFWTQTFR